MASVKQMQGVSSHLEYLKPNDGKRRHPAHCIFAEGKGENRICASLQSTIYQEHCRSAAKCDYYEERLTIKSQEGGEKDEKF